MAFTCQQCGECCSSMGEIIELKEEFEPFSFRISFSVTGEERIVSIDPEKRELFRFQDIHSQRPMACPFLRETGTKKCVCSVHSSRPDLCRQYACYRILVLDTQEKKIGKVAAASRYFSSMNDDLRTLWNREIAVIAILDETCWEEHVEQVLSKAGYRVVR
ncbi:MAG: YkgJ family cysteine cluster protein [Methanoregula sp.]